MIMHLFSRTARNPAKQPSHLVISKDAGKLTMSSSDSSFSSSSFAAVSCAAGAASATGAATTAANASGLARYSLA
jgi:hypothetical protein